ncbi:uncharacterized protein BCR38DRAFT_471330 [Pseudomassariella vexata]|uniref:Uncharacterized protein n=1 Tax=Pseudomassariella vexata TaxID=1141098 RepID=A0A1Y2EEC4_9PEZI|nr:uncharacterized protein BCR38DRAFT_471330 [Pseudomassariella vexata]ORY69920.1 hypothetical protein BCR38DRAFT_471330 [Pseudomassariella vexata]
MAAAQQEDPLDVLQKMFNEVLVQTGKAIRGANKHGSSVSGGNMLGSKMQASMTGFHYALDDLESEITRAKAVLLRDLEKLQAARMPAPVPAPTPVPPAHTVNSNANFEPREEKKRVAPFPDMGMGMSADVVDLTVGDNKQPTPSPRVPSGSLKTVARSTPPFKPSPKPTPPSKVTPVPPPQVPLVPTPSQRVQAPQQPMLATQPGQDSAFDAMINMPDSGTPAGAATADMGGELSFTNMQFSLAPPSDGPSQNAPPAPMQDFDLSSFTNQDNNAGSGEMLSLDDFSNSNGNGNGPSNGATQPQPQNPATTTQASNTAETNVEDLFDLGNAGGGGDNMDLDLSLGDMGGASDTNFDSMFIDADNADMGQFDDAFFDMH